MTKNIYSNTIEFCLERIATTTGDFDMKVGTLASLDIMKAAEGKSDAYEKAENDIFQPSHQKMVDAGKKGSWGLLKIMLPFGSEAYATHMTVNMYNDYEQYFESWEYDLGTPSESERTAIDQGLKSRDMKWVYMATLQKMVRK